MKHAYIPSDMIYYFLLDVEDTSEQMTNLFDQAKHKTAILHVHPVTVTDCCTMLESNEPDLTRDIISDALTKFIVLDEIRCDEKDTVLNALAQYAHQDIKFEHAWVSVLSGQILPSLTGGEFVHEH